MIFDLNYFTQLSLNIGIEWQLNRRDMFLINRFGDNCLTFMQLR